MSSSTNPSVVTLTVTRDAALYIIDCVADRPYKQVAPLLAELQAQVKVQANTAPQESTATEGEGEATASSQSPAAE